VPDYGDRKRLRRKTRVFFCYWFAGFAAIRLRLLGRLYGGHLVDAALDFLAGVVQAHDGVEGLFGIGRWLGSSALPVASALMLV